MNQAFVGTQSVASSDALRKLLLKTLPDTPRCYFLRWVHEVSGFEYEMPADFPSPEGEMLTSEFEIRWKQMPQGYDVLLLHSREPDPNWGFEPIKKDWIWIASEPLRVHLHPKGAPQDALEKRKDTRFPNDFNYPNDLFTDPNDPNSKLQQRYFQNKQTGTVHFVALTLAPSKVKAA